MTTRRDLLLGTTTLAGALALTQRTAHAAQAERQGRAWERSSSGGSNAAPAAPPGTPRVPVVTPNGVTLPHRVVDGVKVFHLVAQEVLHEFAPGLNGGPIPVSAQWPETTVLVPTGRERLNQRLGLWGHGTHWRVEALAEPSGGTRESRRRRAARIEGQPRPGPREA